MSIQQMFLGAYGVISPYNQDEDWSSYGTSGSTGYPLDWATDGDITTPTFTLCQIGVNTEWDFGSIFSSATKVRFYAAYGGSPFANGLKIDSTDVSSYITATGYAVEWSGEITVSGFTKIITSRPANSSLIGIGAIEVDGRMLIDNHLTPPQVWEILLSFLGRLSNKDQNSLEDNESKQDKWNRGLDKLKTLLYNDTEYIIGIWHSKLHGI